MMGRFVANKVIKLMIDKGHRIKNSNILVLGVTFKENCPDIRNTKIIDVVKELKEFGTNVDICDTWANKEEVTEEYGCSILDSLDLIEEKRYDAVVLAVAHDEFINIDLKKLKNGHDAVIYDIKGIWDKSLVDARL
jgi:UDP-N-acetyl-D-galactosamine dehydrogenase